MERDLWQRFEQTIFVCVLCWNGSESIKSSRSVVDALTRLHDIAIIQGVIHSSRVHRAVERLCIGWESGAGEANGHGHVVSGGLPFLCPPCAAVPCRRVFCYWPVQGDLVLILYPEHVAARTVAPAAMAPTEIGGDVIKARGLGQPLNYSSSLLGTCSAYVRVCVCACTSWCECGSSSSTWMCYRLIDMGCHAGALEGTDVRAQGKGAYLDRVRLYWRSARLQQSNSSRVAFGGRPRERILTRQTFTEGG